VKERLFELVGRFDQTRILVLGDFLLDEFVFGEISRVSREAPVLILSYRDTVSKPGGGANTVAGVSSLGATSVPVGFLGGDQWGDKLISCWGDRVPVDHIFRDPDLQTTRKTRILAGSFHSFRQQVVRLDHEEPVVLTPKQEACISAVLQAEIPKADGIILSDYSLGSVSRNLSTIAVDLANKHDKPLVVDSRDNPDGFPGATAVTPNITEVEQAIGRRITKEPSELEEIGAQLREDWSLQALLVTRGKHGMSLFERSGIEHISIYGTDEVVDVTGAGDTVISTFTTALAAGATYKEASVLANYAGGIVVTKKGTATVLQSELLDALQETE
jgi:rfaE bifunctional protein kinase chain/domain